MYKVESKFKNPDKFIEQLKGQVDWLKLNFDSLNDENNGLRGQRIVLWKQYEETQEAHTDCLTKLHVGDTIMIRAKVCEVSSRDGASKIAYFVKETRKVEV